MIDAPASFALEYHGTELVLAPAPTGTQGYDDVRRGATKVQLDEDLAVRWLRWSTSCASRSLQGSRARAGGRRTLELATAGQP